MTATRTRIAAGTLVAAALIVASCGADAAQPADHPPTASATEVDAREQVETLVNSYFRDLSRVQTNSLGNSALIDQVAAEPHASEIRDLVQRLGTAQWTAGGQYDVDHASIESLSLPSAGSPATAKVNACYNPAGVIYTQPDGVEAPRLAEKLDLANAVLTIVNTAYPDPSGWRVSEFQGNGTQPCLA